MNSSIFNVNNLSNILEKNKIDSSYANCYLFFLFFLQRCQLVSNIIKIINPKKMNTFSYGIKYCLLNERDYNKIFKKMKEFRNEQDKNNLIDEILKFIKNSINEKSSTNENSNELALIKYEETKTKSLKIDSIIFEFQTIKEIIDKLDNSYIFDENDIHNYLNNNNNFTINYIEELLNDLEKIQILWDNYNGKSGDELYKMLNVWFKL